MNDNATDQHDQPDFGITMTDGAIRVARPAGISDDRWDQIRADLTGHFDDIVESVTHRCRTFDWCVDAGTNDHQHFHSSRTLDLVDCNASSAGPEERLTGWWAYAAQSRSGDRREPYVVLEGDEGDGARSWEIGCAALADVLTATATRKTHRALAQLLDQVIASQP